MQIPVSLCEIWKSPVRLPCVIWTLYGMMNVRLLFSSRVAAYIRERVWHPSQCLVERRNGAVELRLETGGWNEMVRWILSWQPDVQVLRPKRLDERIRQKMREGLGNA